MKTLDSTLLVISHKRHIVDPDNNNNVQVKGGFFALKNEFAKYFKQLILCVPVLYDSSVEKKQEYVSNISISPLPWYETRGQFIRSLPKTIIRMARNINKADLVYALTLNDMGVLGMTVAKILRKPFFISIGDNRAERVLTRQANPIVKILKHLLIKLLLYSYIRVLASSHLAFVSGSVFMGHYRTWHPWVKTTILRRQMPDLVRPREWPPDHVMHVVFAGRVSPEKNIGTLIRAVEMLHHNNFPVRLTIIGDGKLLKTYREESELNDWRFISFAGYIPNTELLETRFLGADVFILPSLEEQGAKVLSETRACSIPLIASRVGGTPALVNDGINGILFNPHSSAELAQKIMMVREDFSLRKKIVCNGYDFAKRHTLDSGIEKIIRLVSRFYSNSILQEQKRL